jgi:hypothetical protein
MYVGDGPRAALAAALARCLRQAYAPRSERIAAE